SGDARDLRVVGDAANRDVALLVGAGVVLQIVVKSHRVGAVRAAIPFPDDLHVGQRKASDGGVAQLVKPRVREFKLVGQVDGFAQGGQTLEALTDAAAQPPRVRFGQIRSA